MFVNKNVWYSSAESVRILTRSQTSFTTARAAMGQILHAAGRLKQLVVRATNVDFRPSEG